MASDDTSNITGLPSELGIDEALDKERLELTVRTETRRYGKPMTIIEGLTATSIDVKTLASELKSTLATGGTADEDTIELQGDHAQAARHVLEEKGYRVGAR